MAVTAVNVVEPGIGFSNASYWCYWIWYGCCSYCTDCIYANFEFGEKVKSTANTAKAAVKTFDQISAINLYDNGAKYTTVPTVTITGAEEVDDCGCYYKHHGTSFWYHIATGSNYTSTPTVTIQTSPNETTAKVVRFDKTNKELELTDIVGTFTDNDTIVGLTVDEWTINTFSSIENENDPELQRMISLSPREMTL